MNEKETADQELRKTIAGKFLDALNVVFAPVGHGSTADIVLAFDDALAILRDYQDSLRAACREVRNSKPPPQPRPSSDRPARSGTMPSPSEGAARDDWHLADHMESAVKGSAGKTTPDAKRCSTIRPPPPSTGITPVPSIATAATDPAPPKPAPRPRKVAVRAKGKLKRKR